MDAKTITTGIFVVASSEIKVFCSLDSERPLFRAIYYVYDPTIISTLPEAACRVVTSIEFLNLREAQVME